MRFMAVIISMLHRILSPLLRFFSYRSIQVLSLIVVFGITGSILINGSRAATPAQGIEIEAGATAGCASRQSDSSASGGARVQFASCISLNEPLNLDGSGLSIPDTNYTIPTGSIYMATTGSDSANGTQSSPVKTLNRAYALVPEGGTVVVRGGTYRDMYHDGRMGYHKITTKGFTLQSYPHEQVWFDGTDVVNDSWVSDGSGHWTRAWETAQFCEGKYYNADPLNQPEDNLGPCSHKDIDSTARHPAIGDPQIVYIDGVELYQVESLAKVTDNTFFYDWINRRLYLGTNPSGKTLEMGVRPVALVMGGSGSRAIKGIGFKRFATNEYSNLTNSAVFVGGSGPTVIESSTFSYNGTNGLSLSNPRPGTVVRGNIFAHNSMKGMGANGSTADGSTVPSPQRNDLVIESNRFHQNNTGEYGYDCNVSCASAHIKMAHMTGLMFRNNALTDVIAPAAGVWCDGYCFDSKYVGNYIENVSASSGIFHELNGTGGIIASNVIVDAKYAINVLAQDTKIYNNTLVNCGTICMRIFTDNRAHVAKNIEIYNNINYGANVNTNWFACGSAQTAGPTQFVTGFDYNATWRPTSGVVYRWIDCGNDKSYSTIAAFRAIKPEWEEHALLTIGGSDPFFIDVVAKDYRIRTDSQAYDSGKPLPGDVADAVGVQTGLVTSRGAISWPGR